MKRLKTNSFTEFSYGHSPKLSPKEDYVIYSVSNADLEDNNYKTNLYAYNIGEGSTFQLTASNKDSSFIFLDDYTILLSSSRDKKDKKSSFYKLSLKGGEASHLFDLDLAVSKIIKLEDGKFLVRGSKFADRNEGYHEINRLPFWLNGAGFTYDSHHKLYFYDQKEDKLEELFENDTRIIGDVKFFEDKNLLIYTWSDDDPNNFYNKINAYDLAKKEDRLILDKEISISYFGLIDEKLVYVGNDMKSGGINQDSFVYAVSLDGKDDRKISKDNFDMDFHNSTGTDLRYGGGSQLLFKGQKLYFISTVRDHAQLYSIDLKGDVEEVVTDKKTVEAFDIGNEKLAYTSFDGNNLVEVFLRQDLSNKDDIKITNLSESFNQYDLSDIEHFTFENDGIEFDGYVIKPLGYIQGKKYPGLLEIHGGPKTVYSTMVHHEMQVLASQGYFVFFTNPRGSSGRGVKFSDIRGKYGTIDYHDLMKFTDLVLEKYPDIDGENIGVLGGSYGGFMTNWIISHTNRFKAANTQRCITNWTSFYGVSDIGYYFTPDQNASSLYENFDLLWEKSPIKHFDKVETPTLIIHSDQDYRCPLEQGIQAFTVLKTRGIDTKLVIFNGENHDLSRSGKPKNRIKRLDEIVDWFNGHLHNPYALKKEDEKENKEN